MLTGKTAVVTGGSRGIGAAIVRKLASQGANVAVVYAGSQALAEELCAQCAAEFSGKAVAYRCDVADFTAVKDLMAQIKKEFGTVDILVNNAGVTQDGLLAMMKEESFDRVLDVDLKGAFNCIRHCAGMFLRQKHGAIVNVSSVSGMIGNPGQANYSAAKAGLIGLTKAVAKELAPKGITCNAVAPGFIETDMTRDLSGQDNGLLAAIPLGRMGQPQEVAEAVAFWPPRPISPVRCCGLMVALRCNIFGGKGLGPFPVKRRTNTNGEYHAQSGGNRPGGHQPRGQHGGGVLEQLEVRRPRHRPHHSF